MKRRNLLFISLFCFSALAQADDIENMDAGWHAEIQHSTGAQAEALEAWRADGFGIFLHWSANTVLQGRWEGKELTRDLWGEWMMRRAGISVEAYADAVKALHPVDFDAEAWADLIEETGFKYMVFVSKHHDGFSWFDTKVSDFNSVDHPTDFSEDVFGSLSHAVQQRGIKSGFYYSHGMDWHAPGGRGGPKGRSHEAYFDEVVLPHLNELTTKYGPQYIAWFDLGAPEDLAKKCLAMVREHQPDILVSSRLCSGMGDFNTNGDSQIPTVPVDEAWETCMTFNHHWAWYPADRDQKKSSDIIQMLAKIRSRGGNLLLNVGPDSRGRIPMREQVALKQVGRWLKKNGESIYGAKLTAYSDLPWGVCTQRPGKLYAHLLTLPSMGELFVPGLASKVTGAYFLADPKKQALPVVAVKGGYRVDLGRIDIPCEALSDADTVVVLTYIGALEIDPKPVLDQDLENRFIVKQANRRGDVTIKDLRRKPVEIHPGLEKPRYDEFAFGFTQSDAALEWSFDVTDANTFMASIEVANLTEAPISMRLTLGAQHVDIDVPVTVMNERDWRWFKEVPVGLFDGAEGMDQRLVLTLNTPLVQEVSAPKDHRGYGLMIKSVTLTSALPLKLNAD